MRYVIYDNKLINLELITNAKFEKLSGVFVLAIWFMGAKESLDFTGETAIALWDLIKANSAYKKEVL